MAISSRLITTATWATKHIAPKFSFAPSITNLTMVIHYTCAVSLAEVQLINLDLRLRKIVNYKRPTRDDVPLSEVLLFEFEVEHKGDKNPLDEQHD